MKKRNRFKYLLAGCAVVVLGLASRRYGAFLPEFIARYAGDTLWALMVFIGIGLIFRSWTSFRVAAVALAVSYAVEVSQLYHAPWIDAVRRTLPGGLILGYGFLWSDLICYTLGVAFGFLLEVGGGIIEKTERF